MAIPIGKYRISTVVTSSVMGHSGGGMFPLILLPSYRRLRRVIWDYGVTNFTKSSTRFKHIGNFIIHNPLTWKYIQKIGENGLLNAYELTNDGVEVNAKKIYKACQAGYHAIPSFYPQFAIDQEFAIKGTIEAVSVYHRIMGNYFWAMELNYSCHNSKERIRENIIDALACLKAVRLAFPHLCLIAKVSYVHPREFVQELVHSGADIIHAINAIPYTMVFPKGNLSPLAKVGGGAVSGGPAFPNALAYNRELRKKISKPMILGCGITIVDDAARYADIGADVISICTVAKTDPKEAKKIIEKFN